MSSLNYIHLLALFFSFSFALYADEVSGETNLKKEILEGNKEKFPEGKKEKVDQKTEAEQTIFVTANRYVEPFSKAEASVAKITKEEMIEHQSRNLPEALQLTTGVAMQKTSNGQCSPYLRGFTGFGTLMLVDGIRLNNSIFRSGPNQYWTLLDMCSIDHVEVLKGASSALYGSDAIGGTVLAFTRFPEYSDNEEGIFGGRYFTRMSSAEESIIGRAEQTYATSDYALMIGGTYKMFGDVHSAKIGKQKKTGYDEYNWDLKLRLNLAGERELIFAHYHTTLDEVWRTHRTPYSDSGWHGTSIGNKESIHYFDNDRYLTYLTYLDQESYAIADTINFTLYYQTLGETLTKQKLGKKQIFDDDTDVQTLGVNLDLTKETRYGTWAYGATYSIDFADSSIDDRSSPLYGIQGSNPDNSKYHVLAAYVQDRFFITDQIDFTIGTRGTYTKADVGKFYNKNKRGTKKADSFSEDWTHLCSCGRLGYHFFDDKALLYLSVTEGFRTPNLTDLARNGDFASGSKEVPSTDIDPETYLSGEIGFRYTDEKIAFHTAYFYTDIRDQIIRTPEHPSSSSYTKVNGGKGYVHGFEAELAYLLTKSLTLRSGITIMGGSTDYYDGYEDVHEPIRTMPITAFGSLRWESPNKRFWAEVAELVVDKEDRLTAKDKTDTQRIPPGGTPGYLLTDLRTGFKITKNCNLVFSVENLFDEAYRYHGSGSNEPGRNFICSFEYKW